MATLIMGRSLTRRTAASRRSRVLLGVSVVLGVIHHTDHVLRGDHSGWPFQPQVTPFTFSLGVYVLFAIAYLVRARPARSAAAVACVFALTQVSHMVFELPHDQYRTWATGTNLLHVHAPLLGLAAATLSILLSVVLLATALSFLVDARRLRAARPA
jgi:hypothetical protein